MKLQFFTIPVHGFDAAQQALNQFIASHKTCSIEKEFVANGDASFFNRTPTQHFLRGH